jgi:FdhE protein
MTPDLWVSRHPYLKPAADIFAIVGEAAARIPRHATSVPDWQLYASDFDAGIPLLASERAAIDVPDPGSVVRTMLDALKSSRLPPWFAAQCDELRSDSERHPALFRLLLWSALAHDLRTLLIAFGNWRDEERWLRNYCPTCGATPAMGQLVGREEGRLRLLSCGCCGTRWRYRRTGCPFCEHTDDHRLAVVAVNDQGGLRIDYCERCQGYLKTYEGQGSEEVLLADWTSLHLDLLARDRGLKRMAASLYEVS